METLEALASRALRDGFGRFEHVSVYERGPHAGKQRRVFVLDTLHNCENPYEFELHARYSAQHGKRKLPLIVRGTNRCRKCENCMSYRGWQWRQRAQEEFGAHRHTLFVTFTMRPEAHYALEAKVLADLATQGVDVRSLEPKSLNDARQRAFGAEVTLWLKRVRAGTAGCEKPEFRYMLVHEMHKGGELADRPHAHLLLHTNNLEPLVKGTVGDPNSEWYVTQAGRVRVADHAWLRKQWELGFTTIELCTDGKAVHYVCKYVSKTLNGRVRASQLYGKQKTHP